MSYLSGLSRLKSLTSGLKSDEELLKEYNRDFEEQFADLLQRGDNYMTLIFDTLLRCCIHRLAFECRQSTFRKARFRLAVNCILIINEAKRCAGDRLHLYLYR